MATCEWIWDHPEYQSHRQSIGSAIIHVLGKAGSGKTVLAEHVRKRLSEELIVSPGSDKCALLYYYCNRCNHPEESASLILRALIHQLLLPRKSVFGMVMEKDGMMASHSFLRGMPTWS